MSMTGRWLDELNASAAGGDTAAQETLRGAGLWETEEEAADREREEAGYAEESQMPLSFGAGEEEDGEFEPLGIDKFWAIDKGADGAVF